MEHQPESGTPHRRSGRVSIAFHVEASGTDRAGEPFCYTTKTATVSRYGCCVSVPQLLLPDQEIHLRRTGTGEKVVGRIVSQSGSPEAGFLYGVGVDESCEAIWGVRFTSAYQERVLDSVYDGVYFVDRDRKISYWNEGAASLAGFSATEAVGRHCFDNFLCHVDEHGTSLCKSRCPLSMAMADGQPRQAEIYLRHKDGYRIPISVRALPVRNSANVVIGAMEVFNDITSRRLAQRRTSELETLAFQDPLTNLANRRYLETRVEQALQDYQQFDRQYGLMFLDLDRFKQINDSYGHEAGDSLLKTIAETLVQTLRSGDLVGRWGGEEFLALMPDVSATALSDLAERCRAMIAQSSVDHGSERVSTTASIGVTLLGPADSAHAAIQKADKLMYESKHSGGDRTTVG